MLDIKKIKENPDAVKAGLRAKEVDCDATVDRILELDGKIRTLKTNTETQTAQKNKLAKENGKLFGMKKKAEKEGKDVSELDAAIAANNAQSVQIAEAIEQELAELKTLSDEYRVAMLSLPNLPDPDLKPGGKENNEPLRYFGEPHKFDFTPKHHVDLCEGLGLIDYDRGVKLAGSGFWMYKGMGARLEWALLNYFIDCHIADGYEFILPPHMLEYQCGETAGQFPKFADEVYKIANPTDDRVHYMLPTAEAALCSIYRDEILTEAELPRKFFAYTPCFRREAGSYGKDVRGLNRLHEFSKVELVRIDKPEHSEQSHQEMLAHVEGLLQKLELPYRILRLCGGDMSFTSSICYDFEVYSEAQKRWLEVSSVSNFDTYQANRLKCRYRRTEDKKTELCHTLNGSALALPRIVAAIMENNQTPEGIRVPKCLVPYCGFEMLDDQPC